MTQADTLTFPNYESNGLIMNAHDESSFPFQMIFQKNQNGLEVAVTTKSTTSALTMDTQFNVISSTFNVLEDALIQKINYDQRLSNRNQFDEIEFNFFLK